MRPRILLGLALLGGVACASAGPPATLATPPPPLRPATTQKVQTPTLVIVDRPNELPRAEPAGTIGPIPTPFENLALPAGVARVVDVTGRSDRDVWAIAEGNAVLHYEGARFVDKGRPSCIVDTCCGRLQPTGTPRGKRDRFGLPATQDVAFDRIRLDGDVPVARTVVDTGGLRGSLVEARLTSGGRWVCEQPKGDLIYPGSVGRGDGPHALELVAGGASMRFEPPAWLVNVLGGYALTIDGRRVLLPETAGCRGMCPMDTGFAARSPDELWLYRVTTAELWRGNGLAWRRVLAPADVLHRVWTGAPGVVWALGAMHEAGELLRLDTTTETWVRFDTPSAKTALGERDGRFWVVAAPDREPAPAPGAAAPPVHANSLPASAVYRWDGGALGRAEAPFDIEASWVAPSGALWIVGRDPRAKTVKVNGADVMAGAAARIGGKGGAKP